MLIRFGCANYKSIFSYQELLLTATKLKDPQADTFTVAGFPDSLLPSAALYGANASGKTNMIEALRFFIRFISKSFSNETTGIYIPIFKLNTEAWQQTSEFDLDFVLNGQHYHYGYKINDEVVLEEWLYCYAYENRKARTVLFHRNRNEAIEYKFSASLKGENKIIAKLTRANCLFLSTAAQNNHDLLGVIYHYFETIYSFRFDTESKPNNIASQLKEYGNIKQVSEFLRNADLGIESIELQTDIPEFAENLITIMNNYINLNENPRLGFGFFDTINTYHKNQYGELTHFELNEESLGTRVMTGLLSQIYNVLDKGGIFIVDELESSLHPLLSLQLIKLFNHESSNPKGAQLIFTTHETNILSSNVLRRDQIWFSEKNHAGETIISPLSDYNLRSTDNIQKGYLEGRFGAIPFLGDLQNLFPAEPV